MNKKELRRLRRIEKVAVAYVLHSLVSPKVHELTPRTKKPLGLDPSKTWGPYNLEGVDLYHALLVAVLGEEFRGMETRDILANSRPRVLAGPLRERWLEVWRRWRTHFRKVGVLPVARRNPQRRPR